MILEMKRKTQQEWFLKSEFKHLKMLGGNWIAGFEVKVLLALDDITQHVHSPAVNGVITGTSLPISTRNLLLASHFCHHTHVVKGEDGHQLIQDFQTAHDGQHFQFPLVHFPG